MMMMMIIIITANSHGSAQVQLNALSVSRITFNALRIKVTVVYIHVISLVVLTSGVLWKESTAREAIVQ